MAGLTLSALIAAVLLLPGAVASYAYLLAAASQPSAPTISFTSASAILWAIVVAPVLHSVWIGVLACFGADVDVALVVGLLVGNERAADSLAAVMADSPISLLVGLSLYTVTQVAAAGLIGWAALWFAVWIGWTDRLRLSTKGALWYRLLSGNGTSPDAIVLNVPVHKDGQLWWYSGLLEDYETVDGDLVRVSLSGSSRNPQDRSTGPEGNLGEFVVVNVESVDLIDIDYFWVDSDGEAAPSVEAAGGEPR